MQIRQSPIRIGSAAPARPGAAFLAGGAAAFCTRHTGFGGIPVVPGALGLRGTSARARDLAASCR
jgi:hypothetical protein